jgi:DNA mismatch repair protein MSH2
LIEVAEGYSAPLQLLTEVITEVDIFTALATVFANAPDVFSKPTVLPMDSEPRRIEIVGGRHPCVEALLVSDSSGARFIANDTKLTHPDSVFHIITGPNMGGKSTYIRQVGLIVLLAQMGCFVPATSATISVVDSIQCRVGASDSQLRGVSTFMAEMLETSAILRTATSHSLIIIDELGRGTSTYDGFGLAWAISEHIATRLGAFTLFATHFHELTTLDTVYPVFKNFHVSADTAHNALILLYHVRPGACDRSFGIHVAEMANFPEEVIAMAKRKAAELEDFSSSATETAAASDSLGKRQRIVPTEERQGEELIRGFLNEFAALPLQDLSPEEVGRILSQMKVQIEGQGNSFVNLILSTHQ